MEVDRLKYVNQNLFDRIRIPCERCRFESIRIKCTFDPNKCARVDTPIITSSAFGEVSAGEICSTSPIALYRGLMAYTKMVGQSE